MSDLMMPSDPMKPTIQRRLDSERETLAVSMEYELKALRIKLDRALTNLSAGQRIDAHLIANSVMLTEQIARWNLVRDLAPMITDETKEP